MTVPSHAHPSRKAFRGDVRDRRDACPTALTWPSAGGSPFALVTIIHTEGSTPAKPGTKAVVTASGEIHGTIGGGALEAAAQRRAIKAIKSGVPAVFDFRLHGTIASARQPVCGGTVRVLVDPTAAKAHAVYAQAAAAQARRERGVLLTRLRLAKRPEVSVEWLPAATLPSWKGFPSASVLAAALADETPRLLLVAGNQPGGALLTQRRKGAKAQRKFSGRDSDHRSETGNQVLQDHSSPCIFAPLRIGVKSPPNIHSSEDSAASTPRCEVFVEPCPPQPLLLIVGGGHVGQALAWLAHTAGFDVAVIEDRAEFARPDLFPAGTTIKRGTMAREVARFPLAEDTYIALVTRGHSHDAAALAACIHRPAAYIGMIGSRRKVAALRREFLASGRATVAQWKRIFAPIGVEIGAVTVPEIAVSIVAQLIAVRCQRAASRAAA